jgi:hypothetical protein
MAKKIKRTDLLTPPISSGKMLYDKEFSQEIKELYKVSDLNETEGEVIEADDTTAGIKRKKSVNG